MSWLRSHATDVQVLHWPKILYLDDVRSPKLREVIIIGRKLVNQAQKSAATFAADFSKACSSFLDK